MSPRKYINHDHQIKQEYPKMRLSPIQDVSSTREMVISFRHIKNRFVVPRGLDAGSDPGPCFCDPFQNQRTGICSKYLSKHWIGGLSW